MIGANHLSPAHEGKEVKWREGRQQPNATLSIRTGIFSASSKTAPEGKGIGVSLLLRAGIDSFIHLTNIHETPTVWLEVQLLGYKRKQDMVPALREQVVLQEKKDKS